MSKYYIVNGFDRPTEKLIAERRDDGRLYYIHPELQGKGYAAGFPLTEAATPLEDFGILAAGCTGNCQGVQVAESVAIHPDTKNPRKWQGSKTFDFPISPPEEKAETSNGATRGEQANNDLDAATAELRSIVGHPRDAELLGALIELMAQPEDSPQLKDFAIQRVQQKNEERVGPVFENNRENIDTIIRAAKADDLGVIAVRRKSDGKKVDVVAAFSPDGKGGVFITPLAELWDETTSPYELFEDPSKA